MSLRYRPEIDGLRAISVSAVVLYHLGFGGLAAGYVGVDIFFVISGYLITGIIWAEMQAGRFSVARFYERRARRLLPALMVVLAATTIASLLILLPSDLMGYGRSLLATLVFGANVYFWRDTNYFAAAADQKPLLHMWSLGVEEQFYILFPLLLLLVLRIAPRTILGVIVGLSVLSFASHLLLTTMGLRSTAFYLLPSRAWELGVGAILALAGGSIRLAERSRRVIVLAGLGLILAGLVLPPFLSPLPDALPAVIGTAMVILGSTLPQGGAERRGVIDRLLCAAPVLYLGRISYSLYLWHWPIIVLASYWLIRDLSLSESLVALLVMIALSSLTYHFVEGPTRRSSFPIRRIAYGSSAAAVLLSATAVFVLVKEGLPSRLSAEAARLNAAIGTNFRCPLSERGTIGSVGLCKLYLPSDEPRDAELVIYGNSHAQMYAPVFRDLAEERGEPVALFAMNACLPTTSVNISRACIAQAERTITAIEDLPHASRVVIAFNWEIEERDLVDAQGTALEDRETALAEGLIGLVDRFEQAGLVPVVVGPIPVPGYEMASELSRAVAFGREARASAERDLADFLEDHLRVTDPLRARLGPRLVDVHPVLCTQGICRLVQDGQAIFADSNHLAAAELWRFRPALEAALED